MPKLRRRRAAIAPRPPPAAAPLPAVAPPPAVVVAALPAPHAFEHVALEATTPPPEHPREPTPTLLGMAPVDVLEPQTTLDVTTTDCSFATPQAPAPEPTALPESTVLGQPTEDPALAFSMSRIERPIDAFTPPFPFGIAPAPRVLPAALETPRRRRAGDRVLCARSADARR